MSEFKTLKVKFNSECKSGHALFYKQHQTIKDQCEQKPSARTLFVVNVPSYCTENSIKQAFSCFGLVDRVYLHTKPTSNINEELNKKPSYFDETKNSHLKQFKVAYVVFSNSNSVNSAIKKPTDDVQMLSTKERPVFTGMRKWIENYKNQFVDAKDLEKEINDYMKDYDVNKEKEEKLEKEENNNEPDEDGWITVTKKSRKAANLSTERSIKKLKTKEKKKRQQKELVNFYAFQLRDSKKEHIAQLRKKFEEDKKRIDLLKTNRKFKPF